MKILSLGEQTNHIFCSILYYTTLVSYSWSFGVLLWEVWSLGEEPYAGVVDMKAFLITGQRLAKAEFATDAMYVGSRRILRWPVRRDKFGEDRFGDDWLGERWLWRLENWMEGGFGEKAMARERLRKHTRIHTQVRKRMCQITLWMACSTILHHLRAFKLKNVLSFAIAHHMLVDHACHRK